MARCMKVVRFLALFAFLAAAASVTAEELYSDSGFFVDLPEGCAMKGGDGANTFAFTDPNGVMEFQIILYDGARYPNAKAGMADIAKKLKATVDQEEFVYQRRNAVLADLTFDLGGGPDHGYALFVDGLPKKADGAPEKDFLLLAFVPEDSFEDYNDFILSSIDSFSVDEEAKLYPGPIGQFDTPWAPEKRKPVKLEYDGATIELPYDPKEGEAAQALVEREYRVLAAYAGAADLAAAAWARFFRIVYRDCYHRLDYLALETAKRAMLAASTAAKAAAKNSPLSAAELLPKPVDRARAILKWVQTFKYERDPKGSDFVNPLTAAFEKRGDCDSRALLMAILLKHDGVDSIVMVSEVYSHAMAAIDAEGEGARFPFDNKKWLVAETTAKVDIGRIGQSVSDPANWLGVSLPE